MRAGLMLMVDQGRDVLGDFDLLSATIGVRMRGDQCLILLAATIAGRSADPGCGLGIEVVKRCVLVTGEEGVADITDGALHPALLVTPGYRHGTGLEAVMAAQGKKRRVETDRRALTFEDRTFEVVVERNSRHPLPRHKGGAMAAQEVLHVGANIKAQEDLA